MQCNAANTYIPQHGNCPFGQEPDNLIDELLVSEAKGGNSGAFVELYQRHARKVMPRIYRITKNREDAEDAFQDAVLRAFAHLKSFEGRSSFSSWFTRIATNSALMVLRKRRAGEVSLEQICADSANGRAWEPSDGAETPEARCSRRERENLVRKAIRRLPLTFREVVELRIVCEYSASQIAEALGISLSAAKSRLSRARREVERIATARPRPILDSVARPRSTSLPHRPRVARPPQAAANRKS